VLVRQPHLEQKSFGSCEQIDYSMRSQQVKAEKIKITIEILYPQGGGPGIAKVESFSASL